MSISDFASNLRHFVNAQESTRATAAPDDLIACANCLRPKCEHNGKLCPPPYTTHWHAWDYKTQKQPTYPEYEVTQPSPSTRGESATDSVGREPEAWAVIDGAGKIIETSVHKWAVESWLKYDAARKLVPLYGTLLAAREPAPVARELDVEADYADWLRRRGPLGVGASTERIFFAGHSYGLRARQSTAESAPASAAPFDKGPWRHFQEKDTPTTYKDIVESGDFTHDVRLYVNGDFASLEQRAAYCKALAAALTRAPRGYKLLSREPVEAMVHAAQDLPAPRMFGAVWRAMWDAAPVSTEQAAGGST